MRLVYSEIALQNLEEIGAYIANYNVAAALEMQERLTAACRSVTDFPNIGRAAGRSGQRELVSVRPYVIVYRVRADAISIERILHAARRR